MRLFIIVLMFFAFIGCSDKKPMVKETFIPIKCQVEIPFKPAIDGSFESHKAKMLYLLECERLLKYCVGDIDE